MQTPPNLSEKLGVQSAIEQIVDDFYKRVLAEDTVNHFFAHTDMEKQRRHQTFHFLCAWRCKPILRAFNGKGARGYEFAAGTF
ncbi:cyanoglobin [Microseira wollei NIES-4236]|uniref:Cyanoglobin n=1 Tax=Microseira wollei NIES-4236 TaxID=2530354 RepID=A0AAV3XPI6_9CYAN|nr:cyanoglobin [Microseira wollei NIES-4236]